MFVRSPCRGEIHCIYIQRRLVRAPNIQKKNRNKSLFRRLLHGGSQIAKHINVLADSNPYFFHFSIFRRQILQRIYRKRRQKFAGFGRLGVLWYGAIWWRRGRRPDCLNYALGRRYMIVHDVSLVRSNEMAARVIAYLSPYMFWGTVGIIFSGVVFLQ